ncbi:MAG: molybdenum cofactor biosynthesis protein MoaE [Planctomycetota bacterium]|nr:molybdenum cofactor biosynthesis protein MoaE [Planctomycetota bacterium]
MRLKILLFAILRERAGSDELELDDLPEPLDVAGLKRELESRRPELGSLAHVRGVVGTSYVPDDTPLESGTEVALLPPVSGGSGPTDRTSDEDLERGVFEIHAASLDPEDARRRVAHPACGAVLVFSGMTRDTNRGEDVMRLDYEAFREMAGSEMDRIYSECRARFGPESVDPDSGRAPADRTLRMLTLHRTGTVEVGEASVVIAVASPHRDAVFHACRFLIDELKARVPLWKKEVYSGGHHWIGDRS